MFIYIKLGFRLANVIPMNRWPLYQNIFTPRGQFTKGAYAHLCDKCTASTHCKNLAEHTFLPNLSLITSEVTSPVLQRQQVVLTKVRRHWEIENAEKADKESEPIPFFSERTLNTSGMDVNLQTSDFFAGRLTICQANLKGRFHSDVGEAKIFPSLWPILGVWLQWPMYGFAKPPD